MLGAIRMEGRESFLAVMDRATLYLNLACGQAHPDSIAEQAAAALREVRIALVVLQFVAVSVRVKQGVVTVDLI